MVVFFHSFSTVVEIAGVGSFRFLEGFEGMNSWEKILQHMERRVNPHSFATWFRPTRQEGTENGKLVVRVPTRLFRKRLTETYGELLRAVLAEVGMRDTHLEFMCTENEPAPVAGNPLKQTRLDFDSVDHQLNPRYQFESFVVGASNQFAHAAAQAVAEQPSKAYNPLFLYGGVGMGKTHLMQAVGHLIKKRNPAARLTYISAEKFTNEVINSLRFDRMIGFRDRFPRFEWGLIADIQPPDLETKIAILQKKAENERVVIPDDVAEYIARAIKSNVRELEGALTRLIAYASLTGSILNLVTAQQVLRNIIATQEKRITIDLIQKKVGEQFGLREQDLKVRSNTKAIAFPRQVAMYLVKQLTSASLPEIGRQFGGKHHTTVLHSINKIDALRRSDKDLNRTINKLMDSFG